MQEEIVVLDAEEAALVSEVEVLMVSDRDEDNRNAFLEIRAGAGGDEASLFASDLLRMYMRVAERKMESRGYLHHLFGHRVAVDVDPLTVM